MMFLVDVDWHGSKLTPTTRAVASATGGNAGRSAALRQQLSYLQERRRERPARQEVQTVEKQVDVEAQHQRQSHGLAADDFHYVHQHSHDFKTFKRCL